MPIRILAVDDHELVRKGIRLLVSTESDMQLISEASTGREAVQEFRRFRPDITLMDLQMPDMSGIEAIVAIRGEFSNARVIVLTTYAGDVQVLRALKAGARGYLLKSEISTELLKTIRAIYSGRKVFSAEVSAELAEHAGEEEISARELDVLRLIAEGNASKEIAARLSLSEETVKRHVTSILSKLAANAFWPNGRANRSRGRAGNCALDESPPSEQSLRQQAGAGPTVGEVREQPLHTDTVFSIRVAQRNRNTGCGHPAVTLFGIRPLR